MGSCLVPARSVRIFRSFCIFFSPEADMVRPATGLSTLYMHANNPSKQGAGWSSTSGLHEQNSSKRHLSVGWADQQCDKELNTSAKNSRTPEISAGMQPERMLIELYKLLSESYWKWKEEDDRAILSSLCDGQGASDLDIGPTMEEKTDLLTAPLWYFRCWESYPLPNFNDLPPY